MTDDELQNTILERLHADADAYRGLIRGIATDFPNLAARRLENALMVAAGEMDATVRNAGSPTDEARTARRLALLLGMDIDKLDDRRSSTLTMGQLLEWWQANDDFFLRL